MLTLCKIFVLYLILLDSYVFMCPSKVTKKKILVVSQSEENVFYYEPGDSVTYTCTIESNTKYFISWKQITGYNIVIPFPSQHIAKYSITVELDTFDNNSLWSCTVFENADLKTTISTIHFRTMETGCLLTRYKSSSIDVNASVLKRTTADQSYKVPGLEVLATVQDTHQELKQKVKNCEDLPYFMKDGKIVEKSLLTDYYNVCIKFNQTIDSETYTNWDRIVGYTYNDETTIKTDDFISTTSSFIFDTDEKQGYTGSEDGEADDHDDDNLHKWSMPWKIGIGIGVVFIIIFIIITIIIIRKCRNRKKNTSEILYATTNEVVYADLQLMEVSSAHLPRENEPYAKVIGVLNKKKKKPT